MSNAISPTTSRGAYRRTPWLKLNPDSKDNPRWNNVHEQEHWDRELRVFIPHFYIRPPKSSDDEESRSLVFRTPDSWGQVCYELGGMTVDVCRTFCWKDCAIYDDLGTRASTKDRMRLLEAVWREWFPHRAADKDVSHGSFFMKYMRFLPPAADLKEVIRFHKALWKKLRALEEEIPDLTPEQQPGIIGNDQSFTPPAVEHRLRETFGSVFIVILDSWQESGVLLVWMNAEAAARHHCEVGDGITRYSGPLCGDLGDACVFGCSLKRAMQLVVSTDPERAKRRSEYCEYMDEVLGDLSDCDTPTVS